MDRRSFLHIGGVAAAATLVGAGRQPAPPAGTARPQVVQRLPTGRRAGDRRLSDVVAPRPFSALAFGLPAGAAGVWVRTRAASSWSPWTYLAADPDHGPDHPAGSADHVTQLLWTSMADAFQVAAPADQPLEDLTTHLVDTLGWAVGAVEETVDDVVDTVRGLLPGEDEPPPAPARPTAPPRPRIVSRGRWGADESWRRGSVSYARPRRAILHHTATSNHYTRAEVPGILRAIYHYHARVRGWNDIGYNLLVDRFGRIYEGRAGGLRRGVVGAHARGHNTGSVGVAVIGNLQAQRPASAIRSAVADVLAWKYHVHGIPPGRGRTVTHGGRSYPVLAGHRDVGSTACPGQRLYDHLPEIRGGIRRRS